MKTSYFIRRVLGLLFLALAWLSQSQAIAQVANPQSSPAHQSIDDQTRSAVIEGALQALDASYVFPEKAKQMAEAIRTRAARQEYAGITNAETLARTLTAHLQEVSKDKHLRVLFTGGSGAGFATRLNPEQNRLLSTKRNFGFEKVERLSGNIGYLDLRGFEDAQAAGETAAAAMTFLANTDALIIDLRSNGGGSPEMVALLASYFFDKPTHLNDIYDRPSDSTREFWTHATVAGKRYGNKPLFVLTSQRTFSAAEEFTYNLKNLKRAIIVGETTGGGAHPVTPRRLPAQFLITVPSARAINPITKTNWEGTGVTPEIAVKAEQALKAAHLAALKTIQPTITEPLLATQLKTILASLESELDEAARHAVAGTVKSSSPAAPSAAVVPAKASQATPSTEVKLPDTPAGRTLDQFLQAFNSGKLETMRSFHREHNGNAENAQQDFEFYQQTGGLKLHSVTRSGDYELEALVQAKQDERWFNFSISVEQQAPHGITDIRVRPATAPSS